MQGSGIYPSVARNSFRRYATYRAATFAGVVANTVFGFILSYTFIALWDLRPQLGGYDQAQALTFVWVGQGLLACMSLLGGGLESELQERVRHGDIVIDLYRPADLHLWWLASDLGRALFHLLGRGVVPMVLGALAFDLALPLDPLRWLAFLLAVSIAILVSFGIRFLVGLSAFWLMDGGGVSTMYVILSMFFSGMLMPLTVFPGNTGDLAQLLPWAATLQVPADVLLGRHTGSGLLAVLALSAAWAVLFLFLGRLAQSAATRRVVVQGG
ncbi:ABC transporter permease [Streptomyces avicenniae]|uniref:ABC transporter permease n=1 Tax=Streptomyces avicenniae TaxID=500153 RepID=UPI00069BF781|nr:ABC-2 family transporter protein [Streptomyces avicenniae]